MATAMVTGPQLRQECTSGPLQALEETSMGHTQEVSFLVTPARAKMIARISAKDPDVIRCWSTILLDFMSDAVEQQIATALVNDHKYERAILHTLECWEGRMGSAATFTECLAKLRARNCNALVHKLLEQEESIWSADATEHTGQSPSPVNLRTTTIGAELTGTSSSSLPGHSHERAAAEKNGILAQISFSICPLPICKLRRNRIICVCGVIFCVVVVIGIGIILQFTTTGAAPETANVTSTSIKLMTEWFNTDNTGETSSVP